MFSIIILGIMLFLIQINLASVTSSHSAFNLREPSFGQTTQLPSIRVCPSDITMGETIQCSIASPAEQDSYSFAADAGDRVHVQMSNTDGQFGPLWSGFTVYDPDGNPVKIFDANGSPIGNCSAYGYTTAQIECLLQSSGTYRILAYDGDNNTGTGDYYLYLQRLNKSPGSPVTPITFGQTLSGTLHWPAQMDTYIFIANSKSRIRVQMSNTDGQFGPLWSGFTVYDPDGNPVKIFDANGSPIGNCSAYGYTTAQIECLLQSSGTYRILAYDGDNNTGTGDYQISIQCLNVSCSTPTPTPIVQSSLVIIYAVLDNNLGNTPENWERLVNNAEAGVHNGIYVRLLIDGPGANDAYVYNLKHDTDPACPSLSNLTCNGRYTGNDFINWREDTAHPYSLRDFMTDTIKANSNASQIILSLVGHGSGWSANALPDQPSRYVRQPGGAIEDEEHVGGLLWDDIPGDGGKSRSLSTQALGSALSWVESITDKKIDLLYLDACSMGMVEIAYEVRNHVKYLLASPNTDWASFAYNDMLKQVSSDKPIQNIGKDWLAAEANALNNTFYPHTLALYNLEQMDALMSASSTLGNALKAAMPANKQMIAQAFADAERFDTNYDNLLQINDNYVDLESFLLRLNRHFTGDNTITDAIQAVRTQLAVLIVQSELTDGNPWLYPNSYWEWSEAKGLGIYLPLYENEPKRALYTAGNLQWAQDSVWDEFLDEYWRGQTVQLTLFTPRSVLLPICEQTQSCSVLPKQLPLVRERSVYLPIISR